MANEAFDAVLAEMRRGGGTETGWIGIYTVRQWADRLSATHAAEVAERDARIAKLQSELSVRGDYVNEKLTARAEAAERDARQAVGLLRELRATGFGLNDHWRERIDAAIATTEQADAS